MIHKTFEFKLRMNRKFEGACLQTLDDARFVYNCALEHRLNHYQQTGHGVGYYEQSRQLTEARELPEVKACLRSIQQDALERLDAAFKAFFRRCKQGQKPGFPRFRARDRYHTFSQKIEQQRIGLPHDVACPLKGDKLTVPGVGSVRVRLSREIEGTVKQLRITRRAEDRWIRPFGWFVLLVCDLPKPAPWPKTGESVGIDVGLENFATLSTGIDNPRFLRDGERRLKTAQRKVSRRKKGSHRRRQAVRLVRKQHLTVSRKRKNFHFEQTKPIVEGFDAIAVEDLKIRNMVRNPHLAKSICDAGWGNFLNILASKAENAGRRVERVSPAFTSQDCSQCGERVRKSLAVREHRCLVCGLVLHRDHNAAINIQSRWVSGSGMKVVIPAPSDEPRTGAKKPVVKVLRSNV